MTPTFHLVYSPRYALKSVKYLFQSSVLSSGGLEGPRSRVYFRSRTGENDTDFGEAERVRTDVIPVAGYIKREMSNSRAVVVRPRLIVNWLFSARYRVICRAGIGP